MSTPAYQLPLPPHANPIGTRNPVMPTAPNQPMLPGQNAGFNGVNQQQQGLAYVQGQPPGAQPNAGVQQPTNEMLSRPEILEQIVNQQNASADPQAMAEQANQQRIEQMIAEQNQRANQQAEQMQQAVSLLAQTQQQQAAYTQQQLEFQQQQQQQQDAARAAQAARPWEAASLQLDAETQQVFEDSLPVMDVVSRRNALQAAHETMDANINPQLQAMQQRIDQLQSRVESNTQLQQQSFADELTMIAEEHGIDLNTIESNPDYVGYVNQTSNALRGTTIKNDIDAVLAGRQNRDLKVIRNAFKGYAEMRDGKPQQGGANELPPQSGNARAGVPAQAADASGDAGQPNTFDQQYSDLENYRSTLLNQLRRQQIDPVTFQTEIAQVEQGVQALINQAQQLQQPA